MALDWVTADALALRVGDASYAVFGRRARSALVKAEGDIFSDAGFRAVIRRVAAVLSTATQGVRSRGLERVLRALDVDWRNLTEAQRETTIRRAANAIFGTADIVGPRFIRDLTDEATLITQATRDASMSRFGMGGMGAALSVVDERVVQHAATSQAHYLRTDVGVRSALYSAVARDVVARGLEDGLDRYAIADRMKPALVNTDAARSRTYYALLASTFATRSRTYATASGFAEAGIQVCEWLSVLDEVTSEICRFMNGKRIRTGAVVDRFAAVAADADPEAVKEIQPWAGVGRTDDGTRILYFKQKGERVPLAEVLRSGVGARDDAGEHRAFAAGRNLDATGITPPAHGHCRSVLLPVFDDAMVQVPEAIGSPPPPTTPQSEPQLAPPPPPRAKRERGPRPNAFGIFEPELPAHGARIDPEREILAAEIERNGVPQSMVRPRTATWRPPFAGMLKRRGVDLAALIQQHGRVTEISTEDVQFYRATKKTDDPAKVVAFVKAGPTPGRPSATVVKWGPDVYVLSGHEALTAEASLRPITGNVLVRALDLNTVVRADPVTKAQWKALEQVSGREATVVQNGAKIRDTLRQHMSAHGIVARDSWMMNGGDIRPDLPHEKHQSVFVDHMMPSNVAAAYSPRNGLITISRSTLYGMQRSFATAASGVAGVLPEDDLHALSTLLHEQIHGATRGEGQVFIGHGVGIEEAVTEIVARRLTRELLGRGAEREAGPFPLPRPVPAQRPGVGPTQYVVRGLAYDGYIASVMEVVRRETGGARLAERVEQAAIDAIRWRPGETPTKSANDHVLNFVAQIRGEDGKLLPQAKAKAIFDTLVGPNSPLR